MAVILASQGFHLLLCGWCQLRYFWANFDTPLLNDRINPERDWRTTTVGQQILNYLNTQSPFDTSPPTITGALTDDTGASNTDRITKDPTISGLLTDNYTITDFRAGFDNTPTSNFVSVLADRQPNGSFTFNRTRLELLYGSTLPEGTHTLHLKATDQFGNVSNVFDIPFTLDSTPPITFFDLDVASDTTPVGDRTTTNNSVKLTGQTQPDAVVKLLETNATAIADATGKFSFPGVSLNLGTNTFTVQATDIAGNTSTISRTITRERVPLNQAPVITSKPDTEVHYYKPYTYKVTATDPENDPLSYSLVSPAAGTMAGMSIDSQGLLSWTPTASGNYSLTVRVSDNFGNQTDQTYTLKVTGYADNRPPVFTSVPVVSATYKEQYTYQAIALDPDYYSDLTYSLVNGPANMSVQSNGLVSWKPEGFQAGIHPVTVKATDNYGATAIQSFNIAVGGMVPGNNSPLIVSDRETQAYTTRPYTYQVKALDPDNNLLNYSLAKAPAGMTVDANTGKINWDKPVASSQPYDVTIQVQDGFGGIDTQSFQLTVSSATPGGQITGKVWEDLNDNQSQDAGERGLANVKVYLDANNNAQLDVGEKTVTTDETGSYLFSDLTAGYYTVRQVVPETFVQTSPFGAAYGGNILKNGSFEQGPANVGNGSVSVYAYSTPLAVNDWTIKGNSIDFVYDNFWQPSDGKVSIDLNGWGQGAITQVINTTPGQTYQVTFDLTMNFGNYWDKPMTLSAGGQSTNFTVTHVPGQTEGDMKWQRNKQWLFTASSPTTEIGFYSEIGGYYGPIIDNAVVRPYEAGGLYHGLTLTNSATVNNKNFGVKKQTVVPVNRQPNFVSTPSTLATVGQTWRYLLKATDPDSDTLTYSLTTKPDGMTIDETTGLIAWKPTPEQLINSSSVTLSSGVWEVGVKANDGKGGINTQFFQVQVTSPDSNSSPVFITSSPKTAATVGQLYQFTFLALDPEGDGVTYTSPNAFAFGASLNPNTGEINWTPTGVGQADFIIQATDTKGASTVKTFTIGSVSSAANVAPTIASLPSTVVAPVQVYQYQIVASDPNNDPLTYSLTSAPNGMQLDSKGRIIWTPTAANLGKNTIQINVSDGRGGVANQTYELEVKNLTDFKLTAPKITSTPKTLAAVGNQYRYTPTVSNPDNDFLVFTLDSKPAGMVVDQATGTLVWTPTANQTTNLEVALTVIGNRSGSYTQKYTLALSPINTPPQILSNAVTNATVGRTYRYKVATTDRDGDRLTYSLAKSPDGMKIDPDSGSIEWTPPSSNIFDVSVKVEDGNGGIVTQDYKLNASTSIFDTPPQIISEPVTSSAVGQPYQYQVTGIDPTGTVPVRYYFYNYPPNNMTINSDTGLITWNPTASDVGSRDITIAAYSSYGAAYQTFSLSTINNTAPVINSTPQATVTAGATYSYDVVAVDADNDALSYSLVNPPAGMSIDKFGKITWKTTVSDIVNKPIQIAVSDGRQQPVFSNYTLAVVADNEAPKVNLVASKNFVDKGDKVTFQVSASDNVSASNLSLKVNGNPVVLDKNGLATVTMTQAGNIEAIATATDPSGNLGSSTKTVRVIDPTDLGAPNVKLDLSGIVDGIITAPINIKGTVSDANLDRYTLSVSPLEGGFEQVMFSGTQNVNNGVLGKLDPSILQNGSYLVKLTAIDKNGQINEIEDTIDVAGELKLGNFRLSFTDLEIPVAGIPINVTRTYDSLNANSKDDFGYGWRLEFRDTDLRTSLKKDEVFEQLGVRTVAFKDKTRVYITLPGGKREAFTFKPTGDRLNSYFSQPEAWIYHPAFEGDKGVTSKLTVEDTRLTRVGNEYFGLNGGPYNPADSAFGGKYVLTTKEGIVYEIDGVSGDLLTATDTNGNKLTFTDAGIFSDSGKAVTFGRDAKGRITSVTDAMGYQVKYSYDEFGDLVKVTDQENRETKFIYDSQRTHYLKEIIDPLGRTGAKTEYDEKGRLKQVLNGANVPINMEYKPEESIQIVKDIYGKPTTYRYDERGNVLEVKDALGHSTFFEYDEDNNLTQSKDANNLVTKYDYDEKGNLKSRTEAYCGCPTVVPGTTYYTYNQYGQPTSVVLPTGASMKMEYDRFGNMLSMKDGKGSVIQSFTYYPNGLVKTETDTTGTTSYFYDNFGNLTKSIDADGKATTMEYFADGKLKKMVEDQGTTDTADDSTSTFTYDKLGREKRADYGNGIWVEYGYGVESDWSTLTAPTIGTIQRKFTDDGKLKGWVTPDGGTPTFLYDQAGRLWRETDATGKVTTEYGYDDAGRVTTVKDVPTGAITRKKYDAGNRPIEEIDPLGGYTKYTYHPQNGKVVTMERGNYITNSSTGQLVVDPVTNQYVVDTTVQKQVWNYEYNGLQTTVIDPLGRKTTSVQDEYYLPTETIYKQRDGKDWSTQSKYLYTNNLQEAKDSPTKIIDISGRDRDFTYDSEGRLWKATDLANNAYTYTYGDDGLELIESPTSQTNSGNIKETLRYGYDALGNLNKVTYGDGKIKQMNYRSNDNRLGTTTLPSGETITYDYDAAGQIKSEITKSVNGTITNTVSYIYDANSNVKTITDNTGTTTYRYDPNTGANVGIDYPNGSSIAYTHDLLGRVKTITEKASPTATAYVTTYDYDAFGNLKSVLDPSGNTTTMKYDVGNRLKERLLPNGVKSVYEYDQLDRVKSIVHTNASGAVLASVIYERKGVGEPTKVTREDGSYVLLEYDEALRVKKESYYNAAGALQDETSYGYDAAGKRLVQSSTVSGSKSFNYKAGYQLDSISGAVSEDYDYDANGRLTLIVRDGKTLDLEHDASDRLTAVENETTGNTIQYTYDGQGRRVAASEGTSQRRFLVAPAMGGGLESTDLISDANSNLISNYVYAGGSSPFMRLDASGNPVYYLTDAMGSTIGLADGTGASAAKFNYDSFGNLRSSSGVAASSGVAGGDFRFQGQWLEQGTGIYNFRARDYDAKTGTFLSRDPVDIIETEPESFNPYQFVYHNPHVYSDPTGMYSLAELNTNMQIQGNLNKFEAAVANQAKQYFVDRAKGVLGDVFNSAMKLILPNFEKSSIELLLEIEAYTSAGDLFGFAAQRASCLLFKLIGMPNWFWIEPRIFVGNGRAATSGYNCEVTDPDEQRRLSQGRNFYNRGDTVLPDFIISPYPPDAHSFGQKDLITGDFKIAGKTLYDEYINNARGKRKQWLGISAHARYENQHQYVPLTFFATIYKPNQHQREALEKEAIEQHVVMFINSYLPEKN